MFVEFKVGDLESFPAEFETLLNQQREIIDSLASSSSSSYEDIIKPLEDLDEARESLFTTVSNLNSVVNSPKTQEAYEKSLPLLSQFHNDLGQNEKLYSKLKEIKTDNISRKRVLENLILDFKLSGAELEKSQKDELKEINLRLSELSNRFAQNLLNATKSFEMVVEDFEDVKELPKSDLESAKIEKDGKTKWRFTLQAPSYLAYITYGSSRELREKIYRAYTTRAPENGEVIDEILALKAKKAEILGYENYAEYALESRDASSQESVLSFLWKLVELSKPRAKEELQELRDFARELDGLETLESFDLAYYSEKLKKQKFDFDENETKPYFATKRVVDGLFEILFELFGVEFKKIETEVWHESVEVFELEQNGEVIARLYLDLEARESKRGGAWMHDWQTHFIDQTGKKHLPVAFVVANFPKASKEFPSLLTHSDVVTLFHEMGHAIHHLFSQIAERGVSGVNGVAWDTVEFPSQFLENFAYEEAIIKRFAKHYESSESMPEELIKKIKKSKNFLSAMGMLRQLEFGIFDFMLHQKLYSGDEVQRLLDEVRQKVAVVFPPEYNRFQHGFAHIFAGGYSAGYYSYKWAEVFSADAFFECLGDEGEFKKERADGYLTHILQKGGSKSMSQLYRDWLKREPKVESLIRLYEID